MKLRDLGLGAGLAIGVGLMLFGIAVMMFASSDPGGGIMIVLGLLFFLPGIFIAGSAVIGWLSARVYGSLGATAKRRVKWALFLLPVAWIAWRAIGAYFYLQSSEIAELESAFAEPELIDEATTEGFDTAAIPKIDRWTGLPII